MVQSTRRRRSLGTSALNEFGFLLTTGPDHLPWWLLRKHIPVAPNGETPAVLAMVQSARQGQWRNARMKAIASPKVGKNHLI